jgi:LacI family transcriptional regulator
VFSASNLMTLVLLRAVKELGLRIPEDLSVVAFDDMDFMSFMQPSITAVAQPARQLGEVAGQLLLDRLQESSGQPRRVKLDPVLIERESVARARPAVTRAA